MQAGDHTNIQGSFKLNDYNFVFQAAYVDVIDGAKWEIALIGRSVRFLVDNPEEI